MYLLVKVQMYDQKVKHVTFDLRVNFNSKVYRIRCLWNTPLSRKYKGETSTIYFRYNNKSIPADLNFGPTDWLDLVGVLVFVNREKSEESID